MNLQRIGSKLAFGCLVGFCLLNLPEPGGAQDCPIPPMPVPNCFATGVTGNFPRNGNNPLINKLESGGFTFSCTSSVIFDCSAGQQTKCSVCAVTVWSTRVTLNGTETYGNTLTAQGNTAACGSNNNVSNFTDTKTVTVTDGLYYSFYFGAGAAGPNGCPDPSVDGNYTQYATGTFQNN